MHRPRTPLQLKSHARALRGSPSDAERVLWALLRRGCLGVRWRRQHAVGRFVLDFYCHALRLAIEVDGDHHAEPDELERDEQRTGYLSRVGIRVVRFPARQVVSDQTTVLTTIASVQEDRRAELARRRSP